MNSSLSRIIGLCALGWAALGRAAMPAPAELQDGPPRLGLVEQERFRVFGLAEQELYRLRVPVHTALSADPAAAAAPTGAVGVDEPRTPQRPAAPEKPGCVGQQCVFPLLLVLAWVVTLRRIFVQNSGKQPRIRVPSRPGPGAQLSPAARAREKAYSRFVSAFQVQLSGAESSESVTVRAPRGRFFRQPLNSLSKL